MPALVATLSSLPPGLTELMCHPGYPDAELARRTSYATGRERELAALIEPTARAALAARGVALTTYRQECGRVARGAPRPVGD